MMEHRIETCRKLCEAIGTFIEALAQAGEYDRLEMLLFRCGNGCFVTYEGGRRLYQEADYDLYDYEGITVEVGTAEQAVKGTVDGVTVGSYDLSADICEWLDRLARSKWENARDRKGLKENGYVTVSLPAGPR